MHDPPEGSVTCLFRELKCENVEEAAKLLWERYFSRVVSEARRRLARPLQMADEEDVAASVFESLFRGARQGRFDDIAGRVELWRLILAMTKRKLVDLQRNEMRQKRGCGKVVHESMLTPSSGESSAGCSEMASHESALDPSIWLREWLGDLEDDDTLFRVANLRLSLCTNQQIADRLGISVKTVERKLRTIRGCWRELV